MGSFKKVYKYPTGDVNPQQQQQQHGSTMGIHPIHTPNRGRDMGS
jgi:hypothetical protein